MTKKKIITHYTAEEIAALQAHGKSRTRWAKAAAMSGKQLEASIAADADEADMAIDWENASVEMPPPKAILNMRVDRAVLDFFKQSGRGYQTRINAVLKSFVDAQHRHSAHHTKI